MGMDRFTYVGIYVECINPSEEVDEMEPVCSQHGVNYNRNFCPGCGEKITQQPTGKKLLKPTIDPDNFMPFINDHFEEIFDNGGVVQTIDGMYKDRFYPREYELGLGVNISNGEIYIEEFKYELDIKIKEFESLYKKQLEILKKHYGNENVSVKFGIIQTFY